MITILALSVLAFCALWWTVPAVFRAYECSECHSFRRGYPAPGLSEQICPICGRSSEDS